MNEIKCNMYLRIHNFLGFWSKGKNISDYPVKEFWKSDDFWASSTLLKKYSR